MHPGSELEATDVTAPIVALGGIIRVYPHRNFSLTAEFTGIKVFGFTVAFTDRIAEDLEAKMYDLDLYGTLNFGRHVGVQGGYRSVTADYLVEEDSGELKMKGLYFGGSFGSNFQLPTSNAQLPNFNSQQLVFNRFGSWSLEIGSFRACFPPPATSSRLAWV